MLVMMQMPWIRTVHGFDWEKDHVDQAEELLQNAQSKGMQTPYFVDVRDIRTVTCYEQGVLGFYCTGMTTNPMSHL
jgi:hypothetical protein